MYGPRVFDSPGVRLRPRKLRLLHAVRQLKNNTQHQAEHNCCRAIETRYNPNGMKQQWDAERYGEKTHLTGEEHCQVPTLRARQSMLSNSSRDDVSEVAN